MNQFEERVHALKVEYKANKAAVWEEWREKNAQLKKQKTLVNHVSTITRDNFALTCVVATINEHRCMLQADRDRKLSKLGRTYHFQRKEAQTESETFYQKGGEL